MLRVGIFLCVCAYLGVAEAGRYYRKYRNLSPGESLLEDAWLEVPQLVEKYGYPVEVHYVVTKDGYILTMHRIRHGKDHYKDPHADRPVVFLMHGMMSSSADWVVMGPGKGLAYILAEEGFDVWLGNARGNRYSRSHRSRDPDDADFWKFSWDEIGNIDVPAMIDYALGETEKEKLHYIGHSQGTTTFFVMCSLRPEYNRKIISMNALAPVAYMAYSGDRLRRFMAPFSGAIMWLLENVGVGEMFPTMNALRNVGADFCSDSAITQGLCSKLILLMGWNSEQFNKTMVPVQLGHVPAGVSARQFAHYGQNIHSRQFRRYDYGYLKNYQYYGSTEPPSYNLRNIRVPVYLHYAVGDTSAHYKDVRRLKNEIHAKESIKIPLESFNHLDFLWGIDAKKLVYDKVIRIMKSYSYPADSDYEYEY